MTNPLHIPRPQKEQRVNTRNVQGITAEDAERPTAGEYMAKALVNMQRHLQDLVKRQIDQTKIFDQYLAQEWNAESEVGQLTLQPAYEYTEKVETIIVLGAAAATVTLQLGDRYWPLIIPATGILILSPVGILLDRSDIRQLSFGTPGNYSLELMGHADQRWST